MTFGEALRFELIQIPQLNNKVFPVIAPASTESAFLVYKRKNVDYKKTLSGRTNLANAIYELSIVTNSYAEKEEIESLITVIIMSFLNRNIGDNGPYIQDVTFRLQEEIYAFEPDLISSTIQLEVIY